MGSYWDTWNEAQRKQLRKLELESEQLSITGRFRCVPIPARSPLVSGSWRLPSWHESDLYELKTALEKSFFRTFNVEEEREEVANVGMDRKSSIKARLAQLEAELASLDRFPADDFADGTVVTFDRLIDETVYSYAAIKASGVTHGPLWYVTGGGSAQRLTWTALTEWIADTFTGEMRVMEPGRVIAGEAEAKTEAELAGGADAEAAV